MHYAVRTYFRVPREKGKKMIKELVLVRHGQSTGNLLDANERTKMRVGTNNYDITDLGVSQAEATGAFLQERYPEGFDAYMSSYYARTKQTLRVMYPDVPRVEDPRLAESNRGIWHVMSLEEVTKSMPWEVERREREGLYHYRPPGGENWPDLEIRIMHFVEWLNREYAGKRVLVVGHGTWLLVLERVLTRINIEEMFEIYNGSKHDTFYENTSVTIYSNVDGALMLTERNIVPWRED